MSKEFLSYIIKNYPNSYQLGEILKVFYYRTNNKDEDQIKLIENELISNGIIKFLQ